MTKHPRQQLDPQVVTVTPETARRWLEHNTRNRRVDQTNVDMFVRLIRNGRWALTNDAIAFADDGTLLNGQHRLTAIVEAGSSCQVLVIRGMPADDQVHMDTGKKRSAGDHLAILGMRNYSNLAAISRVALLWQRDALVHESNHKVSPDEITQFIFDNPDLVAAAEYAVHIRTHLETPVSVAGCAVWLLRHVDAQDADLFMDAWSSGAGLNEGSPILALTQRLREVRRNRRRVSRAEHLALILRAWNLWRDGKSVASLPLRARASGPVDIPKAH